MKAGTFCLLLTPAQMEICELSISSAPFAEFSRFHGP